MWPVKAIPARLTTPLMDRRRRHGREFAAAAAGQGAVEKGQHIGGVGGVEPPRLAGGGERQMEHVEDAGGRRRAGNVVAQHDG